MVMLDILRRIAERIWNFFLQCSTRKSRHSWKGSTAGSENGAEDLQKNGRFRAAYIVMMCRCLSAEWKMGTEEAGRKVRRAAFEEEKKKCTIF